MPPEIATLRGLARSIYQILSDSLSVMQLESVNSKRWHGYASKASRIMTGCL